MQEQNPIGIKGIEFIEFCSPHPDHLHRLFLKLGFSKISSTAREEQIYYNQNEINFIINQKINGHSAQFKKIHGPSISSIALKVRNANEAFKRCIDKGARVANGEFVLDGKKIPALYGIGDSLIYLIDQDEDLNFYQRLGFGNGFNSIHVKDKGFTRIDHMTNNVPKGTLQYWANFYKEIFGFTEVRYFDIRGEKTGLVSYALKSPCGTFSIPINEGTEEKSQINEYLEEYKGAGIQHLALLTDDILKSLDALRTSHIDTLNIDQDYYETIFDRVQNVTEDHQELKDHKILIDGDQNGYLLQIFTKNIIGPIFLEIIQRKNHQSFGEGNFGALFRSIERDQEMRGYLK
jgi:4-hydroxyphenylpyruvate dioxygenase